MVGILCPVLFFRTVLNWCSLKRMKMKQPYSILCNFVHYFLSNANRVKYSSIFINLLDTKPTIMKNFVEKRWTYWMKSRKMVQIYNWYLVQTMFYIGWNLQKMNLRIKNRFRKWFALVSMACLCGCFSICVKEFKGNFVIHLRCFSRTRWRHDNYERWFHWI